MKKTIRRISILLIVLTMILNVFQPISAEEVIQSKEEIVYAILNNNGAVEAVYVVNIVQPDSTGKIIDFGAYSEVRNMTSVDLIEMDQNQITIQTEEKELYYQGNLISKELPWHFDITYILDGEVYIGDIAGQTGALEMIIEVTKNEGVNAGISDNLTLQIEMNLDTDICKNIVAEGATMVNRGSEKNITYTIMPGEEKRFTIYSHVEAFEMDPIEINAIPFAIDLDIDKEDFLGEFEVLETAVASIGEGSKELESGLQELSLDVEETLLANGQLLVSASSQLVDATDQIGEGSTALSEASTDLSDGAKVLNESIIQLSQEMLLLQEGLELMASDNPEIAGLQYQLGVLIEVFETLTVASTQVYDGNVAVSQGLNELAINISELNNQVVEFDSGMVQLEAGMVALDTGVEALYNGAVELALGTESLNSKTLNFNQEVGDEIDQLVEGLVGDPSQIVSFTSTNNKVINNLQFNIRTQGIKIADMPVVVVKEESLNFFQKILRLFGLY